MARRYFEEEMRYLHEAGKRFAERHPEQARMLNIDSVTDRDPYVERLFEGFAFLTGRIHERLDDDVPEYTEALTNLLYPHFLKPIPALSIVEMMPRPGMIQETTVLDKGIEVQSGPVGKKRTRCRFTTTQEVRLQPIQLEEVALQYAPDHTSSVRMAFTFERGADFSDVSLTPLRLFFQADPATASTMHLFFTRHVDHLDITVGDAQVSLRGQQWVQPAGFRREEGLLPYGTRTGSGIRLLQEYLNFRRRFWFVDILGFEQLNLSDVSATMDVEVFFDRPFPEERRFNREQIRLFCTPVINLFDHDAEPIRVRGEMAEHRVVPSLRYGRDIEAYDIQAVVGVEDVTGRRHSYTPFFSFRHTEKSRTNGTPPRYYTTSRRVGPADRPDIFISLNDAHLEGLADLPSETLSLELRCTNGSRPREALKEGMIDRFGPNVPEIASPRNLSQPTLIRYPPDQQESDFFWKLISQWSLNYQSLASKEAISGLLRLYDWSRTAENRRRIKGLREVTWKAKEHVEHGAVLRGAEVTLEVEDGHFAGEGDLCLFGLVMSEFLSAYATLNSFVHLVILTNPSEKRYTWNQTRGTQPNV